MNPSDCTNYPFNSIFGKAEHETIALNIMKILKRTGNKFRKLSFKEYRIERLKDDNYSNVELVYFKQVVDYCKSQKAAKSFCKAWNHEQD